MSLLLPDFFMDNFEIYFGESTFIDPSHNLIPESNVARFLEKPSHLFPITHFHFSYFFIYIFSLSISLDKSTYIELEPNILIST